MGTIVIEQKAKQEPRSASRLDPLRSYRIVEFDYRSCESDNKYVDVGDILVALPRAWGGIEVLNCTKQKLVPSTNGLTDRVKCIRDFNIKCVQLTFDENERPA